MRTGEFLIELCKSLSTSWSRASSQNMWACMSLRTLLAALSIRFFSIVSISTNCFLRPNIAFNSCACSSLSGRCWGFIDLPY